MAYTKFISDKPDIANNGTTVIDNTRTNLMALRDAVVAGALVDWTYAQSGGTAEEPDTITYSKSTERVRLQITWTSGNPTSIIYGYSSNSGGAYDTIGTLGLTFDGSGNLTASVWT